MNKLVKPTIKDYFSISNVFAGKQALIHYETQNYNKLSSLALLTIFLSVISIFNFKLAVFPITLVTYLILLYVCTYLVARSIRFKRVFPDKAVENQKIEVKYTISNESPFNLISYEIYESFEGTHQKNSTFQFDSTVKKKRKKTLNMNLPLNEGFGEKKTKEASLIIKDLLGIFKFEIVDTYHHTVLVYPEIQNFKQVPISNNDETYLSGDFEIHKKGVSPNFYGIRHYQVGDPMKFINWKLSGKLNELVVNEYENAVNLKVNYLLNFDEKLHIGKGVNSTWEYSRDLCLSLVKKDIEKNHHVEIFSNRFHIEQGSGKSHFELIELKLCYLLPIKDDGDDLLKKHSQQMEKGSALIFITPINQGNGLKGNIEFIKKHSDHFSEIHIYLIDGIVSAKKLVPQDYTEEVLKQKIKANNYIKEEVAPLINLGVKIFVIDIKKPHRLIDQVRKVQRSGVAN